MDIRANGVVVAVTVTMFTKERTTHKNEEMALRVLTSKLFWSFVSLHKWITVTLSKRAPPRAAGTRRGTLQTQVEHVAPVHDSPNRIIVEKSAGCAEERCNHAAVKKTSRSDGPKRYPKHPHEVHQARKAPYAYVTHGVK
jgi:hypothetical protein